MEQDDPRNAAPLDRAALPATRDTGRDVAPLDLNGFDPAEFEWRPVPRRRRADGWTPEVQRRFIELLADTGVVSNACCEVGLSVTSAYRLRREQPAFARAWAAAIHAAADRLADLAFTRAIEGVEDPVFDRDGCRIGARVRYNDRLLMFLLRAHRPDLYRHAHQEIRRPDEAPPPDLPPVEQAIATLSPATPADPHLLTPPDRLAAMVDGARAIAEADAIAPRDDRERYVHPRVEEDHPAATYRSRTRRLREAERAARRDRADSGEDCWE